MRLLGVRLLEIARRERLFWRKGVDRITASSRSYHVRA
jgi:hypothetical protein